MEIIKKNKSFLIALAVFALLFYIYTAFFRADSSAPIDTSAEQAGSDVLALYESLDRVTLDQTLFASPLYRNLTDFSTALANQPEGRSNPFDIIGRD